MVQYLKITLGFIVYGKVVCQFKASHHESKTSHLLKLSSIKNAEASTQIVLTLLLKMPFSRL